MPDVKKPTHDQPNHNEKRRFEEQRKLGYSLKRALYIAAGSPYGRNRKSMKKWLRENKEKVLMYSFGSNSQM
jgi:hypothetical protein